MGSPLLCERAVDSACTLQQSDHSEVAFVTARLVIDPIQLAVLPFQFLLHGPGSRPRRRIVDGDRVLERVGVTARPTLDEMEVLARVLKLQVRLEVGDVDDQSLTLPLAPGVSERLADLRREMRPV